MKTNLVYQITHFDSSAWTITCKIDVCPIWHGAQKYENGERIGQHGIKQQQIKA